MLTPEQHEARRQGISATDVAAIMGLSPYAGPADVLAQKLWPAEWAPTQRAKWGILIEPAILDDYAERHGVVLRRGKELGTLAHPKETWALASPDAIAYHPGHLDTPLRAVEAKTAGARQAWRWGDEGTDQVPDEYIAQVTWQMFVTGLPVVHVCALIDYELREYVLLRDPELEENLVETCREWYERHLVRREPLPPDGTEGFSAYLRRRFPKHEDDVLLEATPADEALLEAYRLALESEETAATKALKLRQSIEERIGDAAGLSGTFGKVTWKRTRDGQRLDTPRALDALVAELGQRGLDILNTHTKPRPGHRRFCKPTTWKAKE